MDFLPVCRQDITFVDGTVYRTRTLDDSLPTVILPSHAQVRADKRAYAESFRTQYKRSRFQRIHTRRRRPDRKFPRPCL